MSNNWMVDFDILPDEEEDRKPGVKKEKKETTMSTDFRNERFALCDRFYAIKMNKAQDLRTQFGLEDDPMPHSGTELVQRVKDGKYVIRPGHYSWQTDVIHWRDPNVKEDLAGFTQASDALDEVANKMYAAIQILDPKDALAQLEAW